MNILVIGATSNVGRYLVPVLLEQGHTVRAATRDTAHYNDNPDNLEAVFFDYNNTATYRPALDGIDGVFFLAPPSDPQAGKRLAPFIDLMRASGVRRAVLMTGMGAGQGEMIPQRRAEMHLEASGLPFTILRPNWFMQNFYPGWLTEQIGQGIVHLPMGDARVSFIHTRDVAEVAEAALTEDGHDGELYILTGPEALDHHEAVAKISAAARRDVRYVPISDDQMREFGRSEGWGDKETEMTVDLFKATRAGVYAPVSLDVRRVLGREPITFDQFAEDHADAWREE